MSNTILLKSKVSSTIKAMNSEAVANVHPHAQQSVALKFDRKSKQFITGYNLPYGVSEEEILKASAKSELSTYKDLVTERKKIESALNVSLVGGAENEYLSNVRIIIKQRKYADTPFNLDTPEELFYYRALIANGYAATSLEDTRGNSKGNFDFYFFNPQEGEQRKKKIKRLKNKIRAKVSQYEDNKVWLYSVGKQIAESVSLDSNVDSLYTIIDESIEKETSEDRLLYMEKVVNKTLEDLDFDFVFSTSKYLMLIKTNQDGYREYKGKELGKSDEEIKSTLKLTDYRDIYDELRLKCYERLKVY